MKLLRYGPVGSERPAILDADGEIRDLSAHVSDIDGAALAPASLEKLSKLDLSSLPLVSGAPRIGSAIARPGKFLCVGLNYADHARETGKEPPAEPVLFSKATTALCGPNDNVEIPRGSDRTDWEIELGIVIGSRAKYVDEADALDYVAGYALVNDVSERRFQSERGGQWVKGKSHDTFGPVGPWMVTKDEIADVQNIDLWLDIDGERRQTGNTKTMIFGVAHLVHYISQFMTLEAGDIIATGTPPGVGLGMKPPTFLREGQVVTLGASGLGDQRQLMVQA
ncbi:MULTISPECIES: fumarylacetoacetate hydrolase family protein [Pacificibacter]|uniref:fumarylacetoacetate hydrolase family protein n=1 Tax=Pacificibacter TaxID=1042323 RepID=UPI001C098682|nr:MULTISPECIES: fumarylacetoacetate hydrolase family protein [Pacificibacter]MBU2936306.1 fumarylacetoacetate hydrolase family protein [Pacificibacter marinus]MDO6616656.1 fumarylacetoacetate hydrolase family protein [Pacificibacter sp. 1_MG-2023]